MAKVTIGIDNGTSGTVAIVSDACSVFFKTPIREALHYTKSKKTIKLLDWDQLQKEIRAFTDASDNPHAYIERPMVNPMFFNTSMFAMSCYLSTRQCLEIHGIGFTTVDSKSWQKTMLPGFKGKAELKKASKLRGIELYPQHKDLITKQKDADGLLIAHHFHNN